LDKKRFRLSIEVNRDSPLLSRWTDWARTNCTKLTVETFSRLEYNYNSWFIYFGIIHTSAIINCKDTQTGQDGFDWKGMPETPFDRPGVPPWRRKSWHKHLLKDVRRALSSRAAMK
jgi:hypothetical protein